MSNIDNNSFVKVQADQIVGFREFINPNTSRIESEYYGKYLYRNRRDNLIFGICAAKDSELEYKINDEIDVSYVDTDKKEKYKVNLRVLDLWRALPKDNFEIKHDMLNELKGNLNVDKYIFEAVAVSKPKVNTQREFFRLPLQMEIYCREIRLDDINGLKETDLKFEIAQARMFRQEAQEGILEEERGYIKLITADISGGGFMFKSPYEIAADMYLECIMIVDREALPVVTKIVRVREDDILGGYIVHVQFYKISEPVRDRLVKYLINQQRQHHIKFSHLRRR